MNVADEVQPVSELSGVHKKFGEIVAGALGQTTHPHGREGRPGPRPAAAGWDAPCAQRWKLLFSNVSQGFRVSLPRRGRAASPAAAGRRATRAGAEKAVAG